MLTRSSAPAFVLMAFFAIALRLFVPQGMMLSREAGGVVLTLCSSAGGEKQMVVDFGHDRQIGDEPGDESGSGQQEPCAFAVASAPLLPGVVSPVVALLAVTLDAAISPLGAAPGRGLAAPPPPATGPPFLA